ncbi:hypothetical protein MC885_020997 [Smutsia gigantea]|nr:hypothetical protein MC885_020997 [Smutsia gigantea]
MLLLSASGQCHRCLPPPLSPPDSPPLRVAFVWRPSRHFASSSRGGGGGGGGSGSRNWVWSRSLARSSARALGAQCLAAGGAWTRRRRQAGGAGARPRGTSRIPARVWQGVCVRESPGSAAGRCPAREAMQRRPRRSSEQR